MKSKKKNEGKVLACVDQSRFANYVADYAAWATQRLSAPLELLHVLDRQPGRVDGKDHSGAIGMDAQEHLLNELSDADEARSKAARERGRLFLNELRQRAIAAGVESPDVRQRHGNLEESLLELEAGVRLFVLGRRGQSAETTQRDLGRNVEHLVRALHQPILTVTDEFQVPRKALIAFDGSSVTRRGVEMVAKSPLLKGIPIHLLMSGKRRPDAEKQLKWAHKKLQKAGFDAPAELIPGDAEAVIAEAVARENIDILIMGAYGHSPLRSLLFGSKTSDLLRSSKIPTLLLR